MSGLNYYTYFFDDYNIDGFTVPNPNVDFFSTAIPDVSGTITMINNNWSDFGIDTGDNFSIKVSGAFYAPISGIYSFEFYGNDDLTAFYFGNSGSNPTLENADLITYYYSDISLTNYSIFLKANTYYPILLYYGQSYGGYAFTMEITLPDGSTTYDGTGLFFTSMPSVAPAPASMNMIFVNEMNQPMFTNNAAVFYKPASLSSSIGGVRNARRKSKFT
jgi:hypothetical protein